MSQARMIPGFIGLLVVSMAVSVWAADGSAGDVDLSQVRDAIQSESDPALRQAMEQELERLEASGNVREFVESAGLERGGMTDSASGEGRGGLGAPELIGPPIDVGTGGGSEQGGSGQSGQEVWDRFSTEGQQQMNEIWRGVEGGTVSREQGEQQARELFMRETGMDPERAFGMERGGESGGEMGREGMTDSDRGGMMSERGSERMSSEAREQMERHFEQAERESGEGSMRETFEREMGDQMREFEASREQDHEMEYERDASERGSEMPEREMEMPEREMESPEREMDAPESPERESESPMPERDMMSEPERQVEGPPQP